MQTRFIRQAAYLSVGIWLLTGSSAPAWAKGPYATALVLSPDGARLYFTTGGGPASVRILDTASLTFTGSLTLPGGAAFLAISPDGKRLYAVDPPGGTITVIDTGSLQTEATLKPDAAPTARN